MIVGNSLDAVAHKDEPMVPHISGEFVTFKNETTTPNPPHVFRTFSHSNESIQKRTIEPKSRVDMMLVTLAKNLEE